MKHFLRLALPVALAFGCAPTDFAKDDGEVQMTELKLQSATSADGGPYRGELALCDWSSEQLTERMPYHFWTFWTPGCDDALVDLASRAGDDTFLLLYRQVGRSWQLVARNDDCYEGTLNSCIEGPLEAGNYLVGVATYDLLRYGAPTAADYELRVVCRDDGECADDEPTAQLCGSRGLEPCPEGQFCAFAPEAMCGAADRPGTCAPMPEACTAHVDPVCGCDGRTYSNACMAANHGISVASEGACEPVGGAEGETCGGLLGLTCADGLYCAFAPEARCGAADQTGTCSTRPEFCTALFDPVCGCDGRTYSNACTAASHGVSVASVGACEDAR